MKNLLLIFIGIVMFTLAGCGGGGSSNDTPTPVTMVLKISTEGPDSSIYGIGFTYTLPEGVTVATNPDGSVAARITVDTNPVDGVATGVAVSEEVISSATTPRHLIYYTPAGAEPAKLDIIVSSKVAFGIGEFFSITVTRPAGSKVPTAADFSLINFAPADRLDRAIDGINCTLTVQ